MTPRRLLTALVAAATALALAPTAHADTRHQPSSDADDLVIGTMAGYDYLYVWDQTSNPGRPTLAWRSHGGRHQRWTVEGSSFKNVDNGWCATAVDGRIHGGDCDGSSAQRWSLLPAGSDGLAFIVNEASGTCATFNGGGQQLVLMACGDRRDQRWFFMSG